MHARGMLGILIAFAAAAFLVAPLSKAATIEVETLTLQPPGGVFNGTLFLKFDKQVPEDAQIKAHIDGSAVSSVSARPYISGTTYQYKAYSFTYSITANGRNEWKEYPDKHFYARLSATGTCGNEGCATTGTCDCAGLCAPPAYPPYACAWTITRSDDIESSVNANEGLKRAADGSDYIFPPASANDDTRWSEQINNPASPYGIQTTMRMACGSMNYMGQATEPNGWVKRSLPAGSFENIPGSTAKKITIEPFDESSLAADRKKFIESDCSQPYVCGGIYRDGTRLTSGFSANGTTGEITISNFNPSASYTITYLPPNGPFLCAYTNYSYLNSSAWARKMPDSGTVSYIAPFYKNYTEIQLPYAFNSTNKFFVNPPDCPYYASECNQTATSYSAAKESDPSGGSISLSYSRPARAVSAYLLSPDLARPYTKLVPLSDFSGLKAPSSLGGHMLAFSLESSGSEIARNETRFFVCEDNDRDGYCSTGTSGSDCNDSSSSVHPGAPELCNGRDDDCDGLADEDFTGAERPGTICGKGVCRGIYVCSPDGKKVICGNASAAGREICGNGLDDDCDGITDEEYEQSGGAIAKACDACTSKDKPKPCGSNVGACKEGYRVCINGEWSTTCYGKTGPFDEICNGIDDDCNSAIDDIYGGASAEETKCGCYGGAQTTEETCDEIDNDCNELIDDGIQCCQEGDTRPCGLNRGACRPGLQACNGGYWENECKGGTRPNPEGEICYNGLDDNCNGRTDENCDQSFTCRNGNQDVNEDGIDCGGPCPKSCGFSYGWIVFALGVVLLIGVISFMELRSKL